MEIWKFKVPDDAEKEGHNKSIDTENVSTNQDQPLSETRMINDQEFKRRVIWLSAFTIRLNHIYAELLGCDVPELNKAYHMGHTHNN